MVCLVRIAPMPKIIRKIRTEQQGSVIGIHQGNFNEEDQLNTMVILGNFDGGRQWLEAPPPAGLDPVGRYRHLHGGFVPMQSGDVVTLDAHLAHAIEQLTKRKRLSFVAHTPRLHRVQGDVRRQLEV
eukprot:1355635-Amphidinium_carterae.2